MAHSRETRSTQPIARLRARRRVTPFGVVTALAMLANIGGTPRAEAEPTTTVPTSAPTWSATILPTDQVAQVLTTVPVPPGSSPGVVVTPGTGTSPGAPGTSPGTAATAPPTTASAPSTSVAASKVVAPKPTKKAKPKATPDTTIPVVAAAAALVAPGGTAGDAPASDGPWAALRKCESGGRYDLNTGNGYYGAYQFSLTTWQKLGYPGYPHTSPPAMQDAAAKKLQAKAGWGQWPACATKLGLR